MTEQAQLLPGTLDLLILKAASLGPLHGYGVLLRIEQITHGALLAEQGALYPALYRLEHQGLLESEWGTSEQRGAPSSTTLTVAGRRRLREERKAGTGWPSPSVPRCGRNRRRAEHVTGIPFLFSGLCGSAPLSNAKWMTNCAITSKLAQPI